MSTECYRWDFTIGKKNDNINEMFPEEILIDSFRKKTKQYSFQLEESNLEKKCGHDAGPHEGYIHYQGRISLIKKKSGSALIKFFNEEVFKYVHWSPTSIKVAKRGDDFYVTKVDTRLKGPWTDKDEIIYIPRQIREMEGLRPFQQSIVDNAEIWDKRTINLIYCKHGNMGKSLLVGYCRAHKIGRALPPVNDQKDLLRMVCDLPTSKMYLFDMPRSMNKDRLYQFYSAVETIKDGYAYDDRYHFKEKVFDCPNIWIFSNNLPDLDMLSEDRWKIWEIDQNSYELVEH